MSRMDLLASVAMTTEASIDAGKAGDFAPRAHEGDGIEVEALLDATRNIHRCSISLRAGGRVRLPNLYFYHAGPSGARGKSRVPHGGRAHLRIVAMEDPDKEIGALGQSAQPNDPQAARDRTRT